MIEHTLKDRFIGRLIDGNRIQVIVTGNQVTKCQTGDELAIDLSRAVEYVQGENKFYTISQADI